MHIFCLPLLGLLSVFMPADTIVTPQEELVRDFMKSGDVPGLFVAVVKGDSVLLQRAFGVSDVSRQVPLTAATCMELGSIGKSFTAEVVIDLHHRNLLNLDDPITRYLPAVPAAWSDITIGDLLAHTSGIQNYLLDPRFRAELYFQPDNDDDPLESILGEVSTDSLMGMCSSLPLEFAPGYTWSYSNTGYILLGKIAESVTHVPFFATVEQILTAPLGMSRTRACEESWREGCLARGYVPTRDGLKPARVLTSNYAFSAGAWAVSGEDMVMYMKAMHRRALPADKAGFQWRLHAAYPDHPFQYYGGRFFSTYHGRHIAAHNGGTPGFSSSWIYVEEDTASIIILANRQDYAPVDRLAWDLLACYLPHLRYPSHAIESPEGREWGEVVLVLLDSVRTGRKLPSRCSKPLRTFMESQNGRGLWNWYFFRGFPTALVCVDAESSEGLERFRYRLTDSAGTEYCLTAVVNSDNELAQLYW